MDGTTIQGVDRTLQLPKELIHHMLPRLLTMEAARTSVLSKTWLRAWSTYPNLDFTERNFTKGPSFKSMESIAVSLSGLGLAVGSLLASLILSTVADITKRGRKGSWISNNINRSHYESYYWLLAVLSSVNLLYFLLCSWAYGPCAYQGFPMLKDEGKDLKEEELPTVGNVGKNGEEKSKEDGVLTYRDQKFTTSSIVQECVLEFFFSFFKSFDSQRNYDLRQEYIS